MQLANDLLWFCAKFISIFTINADAETLTHSILNCAPLTAKESIKPVLAATEATSANNASKHEMGNIKCLVLRIPSWGGHSEPLKQPALMMVCA